MKPSFFRRHLLLLISLSLFLSGFLIWQALQFRKDLRYDEAYIQTISARIQKHSENVRKQSEDIRKIINESERPTFSRLLKNSEYPYFVFRNKGLYFWSDFSFTPRYENLTGDYEFRFLSLKNGQFIVCKTSIMKRGDTFEIFFFIPLSYSYAIENNYISSGLNKNIFKNSDFSINPEPSENGLNIYSPAGEFLFAAGSEDLPDLPNENILWLILLLLFCGLVLLFLYGWEKVKEFKIKGRTDESILTLFFLVILLRGLMLAFNYPFALIELDLFNSRYFASSSIAPSLGDLLLNTLSLAYFSWFLVGNYRGSRSFKMVLRLTGHARKFMSVAMGILGFSAIYLVFYILKIIYLHSQWSPDITTNIDFTLFRTISLLIFGMSAGISFIFIHILFHAFVSLHWEKGLKPLLNIVIAGLVFSLLAFLAGGFFPELVLLGFLYFAVLYYLNLPEYISAFRYGTYIYFLFGAFICASTGAFSILVMSKKKDLIEKERFASGLLVENDILGEYLLNEASEEIREDMFIKNKLITPFFSSKEVIEQKIKKVFLTNYFDKYDVTISIFDAYGNVYENMYERKSGFSRYFEAENEFCMEEYKTDYDGIYLVPSDKEGVKKYVSFIEIFRNRSLIGYIIVEMIQKKVIPNSVYPELLVDRKFIQSSSGKSYNYAVFSGENLLSSFGNFNYERNFSVVLLENPSIFEEGISAFGHHHLAQINEGGKVIVVSSPEYGFKNTFSNFSFLFLVLILFVLILIASYAFYYRFHNININFSAKIQIFLNIAFFLPLFIVSITTLSVISSTYKENLNKSFIKKAEGLTSHISEYVESYKKDPTRKGRLETALLQIAQYTESDINLFNYKGRLAFSSQPAIFNNGLLSSLVNPKVYAAIIEQKAGTSMVSESVGSLQFNSVYVAIRSSESGELMGILSIPFFESRQELERELIDVLTTIINIFVSIFMIFLLLSYFASNILLVPLKIITQKIKRTTLGGDNEPLEWNSKDEIGLLVNEYNQMLVKLEESKKALTQSEKESAWREMARQVAHEIKNPLTPMKLTIQHLQRSMHEKIPDVTALTDKTLKTLLDQVNNLNEIATSFSAFAKMPVPREERFEISSVLQSTVHLHNNTQEAVVEGIIPSGEFYVKGDGELMRNIFNNLIINGIQSVPFDRKPHIIIGMKKRDNLLLISVRDNGTGIPESIRDKVFIPNFSTKYTGSGIGLAVARRGVEHAGGRIWFETEEGVGSTFFIKLPLMD